MTIRSNITKYYIFGFLVDFYTWMPIWVIFMQRDKGLTLAQIGLINVVGYLIMAVAEIPTGVIADKIGRKYSLALGAGIYTLGMFATISHALPIWFFVGYIFWNLSFPFFSGASTAFLYDSLAVMGREEDFVKVSGRSQALTNISQIGGSVVGGFLASINMNYCFILAAVLSVVAVSVALFMKEPVVSNTQEQESAGYFRVIKDAFETGIRKSSSMRYLLILSSILSSFIYLLTFVVFQPYAIKIGYSISALGVLVFLIKGASIVGGLISPYANRWVNPRKQIIVFLATLLGGVLVLGTFDSRLSIILIALISLINSVVAPSISKILNDEIPTERRSTVLSFLGFMWTVCAMILDPTILIVANYTSIFVSILIAGTLLSLLAVAMYLLWVRTKQSLEVGDLRI